jgi:hypothetical protein
MKLRLIVLACAALMACTTTTDVSTEFIGTFSMQSVNGSPLPFVVTQTGTSSTSLTSDQLTIADGGTWSETGIERTVVNGQATNNTYADNGTWTRSGSSLVLYSIPSNDTAWSGTFGTNTLSLSQGSSIDAVFVK